MKVRTLKVVTFLVIASAFPIANPPPGQLLGRELPAALWIALYGTGALGGILSIALSGRKASYAGAVPLALPLVGPVHDFGTFGFYGVLLGTWAFALHLELMTFAQRKLRWARLIAGDETNVRAYERAYVRSLAGLALALAVGLGVLVGAFAALRALAPSTFSLSLEARHVEGLAAMSVLLLLFVTALALLTRRVRAVTPTDSTPEVPT